MIQEAYVSFEIAKLLKEKGFDENTLMVYMSYGHLCKCNRYDSIRNSNYNDITKNYFECTAPTLQMAMKWLREVHKIYIDSSPTFSEVEKTIHFIWQIFDSNYVVVGDCEIFYDKYETACEAAIKYCLENLI